MLFVESRPIKHLQQQLQWTSHRSKSIRFVDVIVMWFAKVWRSHHSLMRLVRMNDFEKSLCVVCMTRVSRQCVVFTWCLSIIAYDSVTVHLSSPVTRKPCKVHSSLTKKNHSGQQNKQNKGKRMHNDKYSKCLCSFYGMESRFNSVWFLILKKVHLLQVILCTNAWMRVYELLHTACQQRACTHFTSLSALELS